MTARRQAHGAGAVAGGTAGGAAAGGAAGGAGSTARSGSAGAAAGGFTLVEMAIALTIAALLIVMTVPSYSAWMQSAQIRTAAESVRNGLQLARASAMAQNTRVAFTLNGNDWSVDTVATGINIQARADRNGTPNAVIASNLNPIVFNGLGRVTPPAAATFSVTNVLGACQSAGGAYRCLNVSVLAGGQIRLCDPNLAAGDAQSC